MCGVCVCVGGWGRILTQSSKPRSVPTNSLSDFMTMCIREPMHLSTSSAGGRIEGGNVVGVG